MGEIMKKIVSLVVVCMVCMPAFALTPAGQSRRSMSSQMIMAAPRADAADVNAGDANEQEARATASVNQINAMGAYNTGVSVSGTANKSSVRVEPDDPVPVPEEPQDNREKERAACINNNIGVGNTFVWASRYSNADNYATMIEDIEEPDNNICFVKVDVKSSNPDVSVSDVPSKYFAMGTNITCGSWADEGVLRDRILDATKKKRVWASVGATVGGAGLGVGMMELFGNKLIGGNVEGQRALEGDELILSQLRVLKNESPSAFRDIMDALELIEKECNSSVWDGAEKPSECDEINYKYLLNARNG